jgi:hypothetical protein
MADGFKCANCGWQETEHEIGHEDAEEHIPGYRNSLANCQGFQLSTRDERRSERMNRLSEDDTAWMERRARGRAGWSLFGAIQRHINFKEKLYSLPDKDRPAFIEECRKNNRTLIIG